VEVAEAEKVSEAAKIPPKMMVEIFVLTENMGDCSF
jgi:hypothetical protein